MKVLMIAPQPFFEPRGTPISVFQRLHGLSALGYEVDLITYSVGEDVEIPGVTIHRTLRIPFIKKLKIGPSLAKIPLDILLFFLAVWKLSTRKYDLIHTHEEAAFFAVPLSRIFRTPHLYDMHSSLPRQLANYGFGNYAPIVWLFETLENWVLKTADVVLTIGIDLEDYVLEVHGEANHIRIENVAVHQAVAQDAGTRSTLKQELGLDGKKTVVYTGTFERYQGFNLLFDDAQSIIDAHPDVRFLMVGGKPEQVDHWKKVAADLGLAEYVVFTGIVSLEKSVEYLQLADILASPRTEGLSVPLKIYSYLQSGRPTVATNILAHTQILDDTTAVLVDPAPTAYAEGLLRVLDDPAFGEEIGRNARALAEREYSREAYLRKLQRAYLAIKHRKRISDVALPDAVGTTSSVPVRS